MRFRGEFRERTVALPWIAVAGRWREAFYLFTFLVFFCFCDAYECTAV